MFIVYIHTCRLTAKCYVGWAIMRKKQTPYEAMMRRWETHVKAAMGASRLVFSWAIRKHGVENWDHEVLEVFSTKAGAKHAEKLWIAQRRTCIYDHPASGYNMTRGGDGGGMLGHVPTQEHREKISEALKGKPKSAAAKKSMQIAKIGKPSNARGSKRPKTWYVDHGGEHTPNAKLTEDEKVTIRDRWANRYEMKVNQRQLAQEYGVTQSTISRLLGGKTWK